MSPIAWLAHYSGIGSVHNPLSINEKWPLDHSNVHMVVNAVEPNDRQWCHISSDVEEISRSLLPFAMIVDSKLSASKIGTVILISFCRFLNCPNLSFLKKKKKNLYLVPNILFLVHGHVRAQSNIMLFVSIKIILILRLCLCSHKIIQR